MTGAHIAGLEPKNSDCGGSKKFFNIRSRQARENSVSVLDQVRQFMHTAPTHDDVTTLALVRNSYAAG
jgi:hypothetical protein